MQVENLSNEQVKAAQDLFDTMGSPVTHKTYSMEDMDFAKRLTAIEESISDIKNKLELIFGGHALVKGQWIDTAGKARKALRKSGFNHNR